MDPNSHHSSGAAVTMRTVSTAPCFAALLPVFAAQSCTLDPCVRDQYVAAMSKACADASSTTVNAAMCTAIFSNAYGDGPKCQATVDNTAGSTTCSWGTGTVFGQDAFNGLDASLSTAVSALCSAGATSAANCTAASASVVTKVNKCASGGCTDGTASATIANGTKACVFDAGTAQSSHACKDASDAAACVCPASATPAPSGNSATQAPSGNSATTTTPAPSSPAATVTPTQTLTAIVAALLPYHLVFSVQQG